VGYRGLFSFLETGTQYKPSYIAEFKRDTDYAVHNFDHGNVGADLQKDE
jgi:hypothetical protein